MNIWIVWFNNFHGVAEFSGAFSSEAHAQAFINRYSKSDRSSFYIEENLLDSY